MNRGHRGIHSAWDSSISIGRRQVSCWVSAVGGREVALDLEGIRKYLCAEGRKWKESWEQVNWWKFIPQRDQDGSQEFLMQVSKEMEAKLQALGPGPVLRGNC